MEIMNSSHHDGNDMIKWYEFNIDCMTRKGIKVPTVNCHGDINNTIFLDISSKVFQICGFEAGVGVLKQGGPLNSTRARFLNHQTSKISIISIWAKISFWVFQICRFGGGVGVLK